MKPMSIYWPVDTEALACFPPLCMGTEPEAKNTYPDVFRRVRFPGITRFAGEYGYNYVSVYRHLTGERPSLTIARKWAAWQEGRKAV